MANLTDTQKSKIINLEGLSTFYDELKKESLINPEDKEKFNTIVNGNNQPNKVWKTDGNGNPTWGDVQGGGGDSGIELTQVEYDKLTDAEKNNGLYYITDANLTDSNDIQLVTREVYELLTPEQKANQYFAVIDNEPQNMEINIPVDSELDGTSSRPVQNKVVAQKFEEINTNISTTLDLAKKELESNLTQGNIHFKFGVDEEGNYGYIKEGADSVTPFLMQDIKIIQTFSQQTSDATNAAFNSYTFDNDYRLVIVNITAHDTDNNGDNVFKVYDEEKSTKVMTTLRPDTSGQWDSLIRKIADGTAISATAYEKELDRSRDLYFATGTSSSTAFLRTSFKFNVKKNDVIYIYYNAYRRTTIDIIGIK